MANERAEHREGSARLILLPPAKIIAGLIALTGILSLMTVTRAYAQQPGPNEVIVYEHAEFAGAHRSWKLEPGMRQKLVPYVGNDVNDRISAIQVGSDVGVAVFHDADFCGAYYFFDSSQSAISESEMFSQGFNDVVSSLIIYPKGTPGPLGVFLSAPWKAVRFFPLPEEMNQVSSKYPSVGDEWNDLFEHAFIVPDPTLSTYGGHVEAVLYELANFGGKCITIPGPAGGKNTFNLADFQFQRAISSVEVRWVGTLPAYASARPAQDTRLAPLKKTPSPPLSKVTGTNISGQWNSNIGAVYQIQQSGNQFTWSVPSLNQSGTGTISAKSITLSGPGWTVKGQVTETDTSGNPAKIVGENGVVLTRADTAAPGAPMAPSVIGLAGQWKSSIGRVYDITQQGNQIAWTVVNSDEKGQGTITGGDVSASWKGFLGSGSSSGKITVDSSGKATEIKWNNGVRFYR